MPDSFTGGCACGAIRYSSSGPARYMGNCHCRHCQRATGSAYFPAVLVKESDFKLEQGYSPEEIIHSTLNKKNQKFIPISYRDILTIRRPLKTHKKKRVPLNLAGFISSKL